MIIKDRTTISSTDNQRQAILKTERIQFKVNFETETSKFRQANNPLAGCCC